MNVQSNPTLRIRNQLKKGNVTLEELSDMTAHYLNSFYHKYTGPYFTYAEATKYNINPGWNIFVTDKNYQREQSIKFLETNGLKLVQQGLPEFIINYIEVVKPEIQKRRKWAKKLEQESRWLKSPEGQDWIKNKAIRECMDRVIEFIEQVKPHVKQWTEEIQNEKNYKYQHYIDEYVEGKLLEKFGIADKWLIEDISERTIRRHAITWDNRIRFAKHKICYKNHKNLLYCRDINDYDISTINDINTELKVQGVNDTGIDEEGNLIKDPIKLMRLLRNHPDTDTVIQELALERLNKRRKNVIPIEESEDRGVYIKSPETGNFLFGSMPRKIALQQQEEEPENSDNFVLTEKEYFKKWGHSDRRIQIMPDVRDEIIKKSEI